MANKRTVFDITADTWVEVVNGETSASILRSKKDVTYYSMSFDDDTSVPTGLPSANPTAEKMFVESIREPLSDSALTYIWVRCAPEQVGRVIVTL